MEQEKTLDELMKAFGIKSIKDLEEKYKKSKINIGFFVSKREE